jgi:hypothetical protein
MPSVSSAEHELDGVLRKLNTVYPGMWNGMTSFYRFKVLSLRQFTNTWLTVRVDPQNTALVAGNVEGLYSQICKRRDGLGVLAKERLPPPAPYGLSLSSLPVLPDEVMRVSVRAWLHLSGEPVVLGRYDRRDHQFYFKVPLWELEAIVDALANAPKEEEVVFGS